MTKVLVVESGHSNVGGLKGALTKLGLSVLPGASSAREAIEAARIETPDLLIMGSEVPGETSGSLAETLDLPVVHLTSYVEPGREHLLTYLLEPYTELDLKNAIEIALLRHRISSEVKSHERLLRSALDQVSDGVVHANAEGAVQSVNAAASRIFGAKHLEEKIRAAHASMLHDASIFHVEDTGVHTTVAPLLGPRGAFHGFVMVMRDDRERSLLQDQLAQADRMSSLGLMAAGIAHEINNPLAYITANVEYTGGELQTLLAEMEAVALRLGAVKAGKKSGVLGSLEEMSEAMVDTREGTDRLRRIVEDLRVFSHPGTEESPLDPKSSIQLATRICTPKARTRAKLELRLEQTPRVKANQGKLAQILLNLIANAIEAIPEGSVENNRVFVELDTGDEGQVRIRVGDTGQGMNAETKARIFQPFFTTKASGSGTGLGLSIVKRLVNELNGELSVESELGKGSTFTLILPAAPDEETRAVSRPAKQLTRRARILILDDEPLILLALRRLLSRDYEVVAIQNPVTALERIRAGERFDLLLCDLIMPELSGWDLFDELRRIAPDQAHNCVFLTGAALHSQARQFLERVENRRLEKPFDADSLERALREMLEAQRKES
jgi:signal transduction histidine kinase/DNA-binding NarL/FixJ family response regulator